MTAELTAEERAAAAARRSERLEWARRRCPFRGLLPELLAALEAQEDTRGLLLAGDPAAELEARGQALEAATASLRVALPTMADHACEACQPAILEAADKCAVEFNYALTVVRDAQDVTLRKLVERLAPAGDRATRRRQERERQRVRESQARRNRQPKGPATP